ncbi:STAS domain-containing protein [Sodaliphilus sp.]|uniref:STAS domain-containing protein n=1 Tax=Sodaliphilus sp. TaxID=2815818 RepID=UPI00389082A8
MEFNIAENASGVLIKFAGRLDTMSAQNITEQVQSQADSLSGRSLSIDCSELEYISSSGIRLFLFLRKAAGSDVALKGVRPEILQILKVTKLDTMFTFE